MNDLFRLILQRPGMAEKYDKWKRDCPDNIKHLNVPADRGDLATKKEDSDQ